MPSPTGCPALRPGSLAGLALSASAFGSLPAAAQETLSRIPLVPGLTMMSSLHFPEGDRENVVEVGSVDSSGASYTWRLLEVREGGDTLMERFGRRVRANDLAGAPRLDPVFKASDPEERPGYTAFSISSAVYTELRDRGTAPYSVTSIESSTGVAGAAAAALGLGLAHDRARYRGTLTRASPTPESFPLLVDGRRVAVPALHLTGTFTKGLRRLQYEFWVLADSAHPLLLRTVVEQHVFQMVRVNFPSDASGVATLERELDTACRIELPGVYFAFNSARIDPASDHSLAGLARVLAGHPEWVMTVEGHTDSIGTAAANQQLSQRRAEAVRARLAQRHGVNTSAWNAVGYGPSRPREPNGTIEGRARNRRVELVREC